MEQEPMSVALIENALNYHGLPLLKIWEGERGDQDLSKLGINNPDFSVYQSRQKNLTFQDRAKRLKLHQFISKNANQLFSESLVPNSGVIVIDDEPKKNVDVQLPLLEVLLSPDKTARTKHFFQHIRPKDIVFGTIMSKSSPGYILKIACTTGSMDRYVLDLAIRGYLPYSNTYSEDKKSVNRSLTNGNTVCCEVQEVSPDTEKLVLEMKGNTRIVGDKEYTIGVITSTDNFPSFFKITSEKKNLNFEEILQSSPSFNNPFCEELLQPLVGLSAQEHNTLMSSLRGRFPQQEYSNELRQVQASKWAFRSVAEGIEYFKVGKHTEAFQCLNKALNIDPRNVEGLVARGALYANSGSFKKAVEDFETALKLNPSHTNARKYMGETLVALGRSYEDENKIEEARKAYQDCLVIIPHHEEAQNSLDYLKDKSQKSSMLFEPAELELPALNFNTKSTGERKLDDALAAKKDKKGKKKKPKAKSSKKYSSSSGSSSSSSDSSESDSESSSDSDSSSSSGSDESHGKRKRSSKKKREKSMSPLSKRMALMSANASAAAAAALAAGESSSTATSYQQFNQPFMGSDSVPPAPPPPTVVDDYELKVRQFLEMTRDEDNYEEKVRKFVEEASKYRKERKLLEEKNRKKKKKDGKKSKKESRKKRKEKEEKQRKKSGKKDKLDLDELENKKLREALKIFEKLPVLDELGSKLSSIYGKASENEAKLEEEKQKMKRFTPEKEYPEGKWKMIFTKDQKRGEMKPSTSKSGGFSASSSKQLPFAADSDDSDRDNNTSLTSSTTGHHRQPQSQQHHDDRRSSRSSPHVAKKPAEPSKPKQVVLDKFGNFRLATAERMSPDRGRSRSKSRKYSSSSKSRSQSPRRRRSRSISYGKRRYSRSRSRSYRSRSHSRSKSYSRSRSRSLGRHRYDRRTSYRGGYDRNRGSGGFYKTRFNPRGGYRGRGVGGGFRDNRDFRGRGHDRPFRARGGRGSNNPRFNSRGEHCDRRYERNDREESWTSDREDDRAKDRFSRKSPKDKRNDSGLLKDGDKSESAGNHASPPRD